MTRIAAVLVLALAQGGCSLMFIDKPPDSYRVSESPKCSTAGGGVVVEDWLPVGSATVSAVSRDGPGNVGGGLGTTMSF